MTFSGDERDWRSLSAAAQFADAERDRLVVMMPVCPGDAYENLRNQARQFLGEGSPSVTYQAVSTRDIRPYQRMVREQGLRLVVHAVADDEAADFENTLATLDCSVLLVR